MTDISAQNILLFIIAFVLGLIIRSFLPSYFSKKGENLATKEDIKEITQKVEEIKVENAKRMHVHEIAYEKEFEVLSELWKALTRLRFSTLELCPFSEAVDRNETEEQRKIKKLKAFAEVYNAFLQRVLENQPFYPEKIFDALEEIRAIAYSEALAFEYDDKKKVREYWETANKNKENILLGIEKVGNLIRERITST